MPIHSICLRRNDFQSVASTAFADLYESHEFTDVTLVSEEGQSIKAHKLIISASSRVLSKLIENREIFFIDVKHLFLKLILQYIYTGQCEVDQSYLDTFLVTAKQFDIVGLSSYNGKDSTKEVVEDQYEKIEKSSTRKVSYNDTNMKFVHNLEDILNGTLGQKHDQQTASEITEAGEDIPEAVEDIPEPVEDIPKAVEDIHEAFEDIPEAFEDITEAIENAPMIEYGGIKVQPDHQENKEGIAINSVYLEKNYQQLKKRGKSKKYKLLRQLAKYKCIECGYKAKQLTNMKHHVIAVHDGRIHYCETPNCELEYKYEENEDKILLHYRMFSCNICGVKFSKSHLDIHVKTHMINGEYCCDLCDYKSKLAAMLKKHKDVNHFICEICAFKADKLNELKQHKQNLHHIELDIEKRDKVCCEICGQYLPGQNYLRKHMKTHNTKDYKCKYCTRTFTNKHTWETHTNYARCIIKRACNICGEHIDNMQRDSHRKTHKVDGLFCCDLCDFRNKSSSHVKQHKNTVHKGIVYECKTDDCQYKSRWPHVIKSHKENMHYKIRHTCKICGITTSTKANLYQHQYNAHNIKNRCDKCGKNLLKSSTLMTPPSYTDTVDEHRCELVCTICPKTFSKNTSMSSFVYHQRMHSGEKPYKCVQCGTAFRLSQNLKRHQKTIAHNQMIHNLEKNNFPQKTISEEDTIKVATLLEDKDARKKDGANHVEREGIEEDIALDIDEDIDDDIDEEIDEDIDEDIDADIDYDIEEEIDDDIEEEIYKEIDEKN